jgi:transcriptional regulator of heat shock response
MKMFHRSAEERDDWLLAHHKMDKLRVMLDDAKRSVKFLTDAAEGLAGSNRSVTRERSSAEETLEQLRKFLPGAPHVAPSKKTDHVSRAELTPLEIHSDTAVPILLSARIKTQALKTTADMLSVRVTELPAIITDHKQARNERENAEKAFDKAAELRSEFMARRTFAEQEAQLLEERVQQHEEAMQDIKWTADQAREELGSRRWRSNSTRRCKISRQ